MIEKYYRKRIAQQLVLIEAFSVPMTSRNSSSLRQGYFNANFALNGNAMGLDEVKMDLSRSRICMGAGWSENIGKSWLSDRSARSASSPDIAAYGRSIWGDNPKKNQTILQRRLVNTMAKEAERIF
jgi:hypothetical protein